MHITVYSTPTCPWCKKTKALLDEHGIEFADVDVSADQEKAQEMIQKSGQMGVPVTDIDGEIVIGYDKEKIEKLLDVSS